MDGRQILAAGAGARAHEIRKYDQTRGDPPSAVSRIWVAIVIFAIVGFAAVAGAVELRLGTGTPITGVQGLQPNMTLETNTDRPGQNFRVFDLEKADPSLCAQACHKDSRCRSYTYVKPGVQGPKARCWLKSGVPPARANTCCASGVKMDQSGGAPPQEARQPAVGTRTMEPDTDRPGMNYKNFPLVRNHPKLCQDECLEDPACQAWTYVKPGIQGSSARCWLKSGVPPARQSPCCISGVKTTQTGTEKPRHSVQTMPGETHKQILPKRPAGGLTSRPEVDQPSVSKDEEIKAKMRVPPSLRQSTRPLTRAELVNVLLKNPRTAPRLNQIASTFGMGTQELATRSTSGKAVSGGPQTVPPTGATKKRNWEAGVRFTPRSDDGEWEVNGVTIMQGQGTEYGLSDMYQRDELLLSGDADEVRASLSIMTPPGKYIITVEFASATSSDDLIYDCSGCGSHDTALIPLADKQAIIDGQVSTYIGQFQVDKSNKTVHSIRFPSFALGSYVLGIFRGITLTRF